MKHIFVLNPAAGSGKGVAMLPGILDAARAAGIEYEVHRTISAGDARNYVRKRLDEAGDDILRFYSVGGDGTMNEVLNGIIGHDSAQLAVIPVGTGNDFIRNFENRSDFNDIGKQIAGSPVKIDALKYVLLDAEGQDPDQAASTVSLVTSGYALNMFNMGFDAEVVDKVAHIKSGLLKGTAAYIAGVLAVLAKLRKLPITIEADGVVVGSGDYLLTGAANGGYSGGGFYGLPPAVIDDGQLDLLMVKSISRRRFLSMVKMYHDGTHIGSPKFADVLEHLPCKEAVFRPEREMVMSIDGECINCGGVRVTIAPEAVTFSVPAADWDE
jgi:diacylglycerol kinase family enzyme